MAYTCLYLSRLFLKFHPPVTKVSISFFHIGNRYQNLTPPSRSQSPAEWVAKNLLLVKNLLFCKIIHEVEHQKTAGLDL